jgi:excinuclease ABC subunit A
MHFLPDVWITCDACGGARFTPETLAVAFRGRTIADVLKMSVATALELFANLPRIRRILQTLFDVGLGYLPLGQPAPTLSGGEAQRVKLAAELARPDTGKTLYILDEPTTGLHLGDIQKLLDVIHRLADLGNTVIIIEHNLEVIKTADWVIDLGPEAGADGGELVAEGTPEQIVDNAHSHTGRFLKVVLNAGPWALRPGFNRKSATGRATKDVAQGQEHSSAKARTKRQSSPSESTRLDRESGILLRECGISQEPVAPWEVDGRQWHTRDRVAKNGRPARWEGRILEHIVGRIEALAASLRHSAAHCGLGATDWSQRNFVRISGSAPTENNFPFFHAATSSEWVVTMRFVVPRRTFRENALAKQLNLVPFHESETPVLCDQPRLKVSDVGAFQEITIVGHAVADFETPGFDGFLQRAVAAFVEKRKPSGIRRASELT